MDDKKNLKPEFKEIYERVMNTPVKSASEVKKPEMSSPPAVPAAEHKIEQASPQTQPNQQDQYLSSVPPRPINDTGSTPFIFSSKDQKAEDSNPKEEAVVHTTKKKSMSPIIFVLIFIFILAYAVFWLIFFGIISIF